MASKIWGGPGKGSSHQRAPTREIQPDSRAGESNSRKTFRSDDP